MAARGLQDERDDWFPLALLMDWAGPDRAAAHAGQDRNGCSAS